MPSRDERCSSAGGRGDCGTPRFFAGGLRMTRFLCRGAQEAIGRGVCMDWLAEAQELTQAGQPFALATVVRRVAPASAQPGAKALILPDGSMRGWVGGSCAQPVVTSEARQALRDGTPRLLRLGTMPGARHKGEGPDREDIVEYP